MKLKFKDLTPLFKHLPAYDGHLIPGVVDEDTGKIIGGEFVHRVGSVPTRGDNEATTLGGARWKSACLTQTDTDAATDGLKLARGMSFKSSGVNLPVGGAKTVIFGHNVPGGKADKDGNLKWPVAIRREVWEAYVKFAYYPGHVLSVDSGVGESDMKMVAESGMSHGRSVILTGDSKATNPSPYTARGVMHGLEATLEAFHDNDVYDITTLRFAVQGVGDVGAAVVDHLWERGCRDIVMTDINKKTLEEVRGKRYDIRIARPDTFLSEDADVFMPCAFGGVLNERSIAAMQFMVAAGCANNQLATAEDGVRLYKKRILYAPDYIINAGGLIKVWHDIVGGDVEAMLKGVGDTLRYIFRKSAETDRAPSDVADTMCAERMKMLMQLPQ